MIEYFMQIVTQKIESAFRSEVIRYLINGVLATAIHFGILTFNLEVLHMQSAAVANMLAAVFGISASFLGSRYFVFKKHNELLSRQAIAFFVLYVLIACIHGIVLLFWTDIYQLDYRFGFLIATILQAILSYFGNKYLVFKE